MTADLVHMRLFAFASFLSYSLYQHLIFLALLPQRERL